MDELPPIIIALLVALTAVLPGGADEAGPSREARSSCSLVSGALPDAVEQERRGEVAVVLCGAPGGGARGPATGDADTEEPGTEEPGTGEPEVGEPEVERPERQDGAGQDGAGQDGAGQDSAGRDGAGEDADRAPPGRERDPPVPSTPSGSSGSGFYVDPTSPAARQVEQWRAEGRVADAAAVERIARRPQPLWVTGDAAGVEAEVGDYVARAAAADARPLLVAYNIPNRDCGSFSGGGAADADSYRGWVDALAAAVEGSDPLVVLEPDAVPHALSGCAAEQGEERYALLAGAVDVLTEAGADVYVDAGHPGFVGDVDATADALERSGARRAAGFSLNVANFVSTEENIEHGTAVSERLGGAPFVIDTSRNGASTPPASRDGAPSWCNPPGRALGEPPTTDTGSPLVDAYLWIKRPGESDGACRPGDPPAGRWFPDYALALASAGG